MKATTVSAVKWSKINSRVDEYTTNGKTKEEHMNTLLIVDNNGQPVVSSRKIAEDFGKEHKVVLRNIREILVEQNCATKFFSETSFEYRGQQFPEFLMNRDGFTLLAMGFTGKPALQWKLKYITAFNEMERKMSALPKGYKVPPQNYLECLKELVSTTELLQLTCGDLNNANETIATLEPKAKAFDLFVDDSGYYSIGTTAKMLGTGRNRLFMILRLYKIIMDTKVPYQKYIEAGYFTVKAGLTYVSPKGLQWLSEKFSSLCVVSTDVSCDSNV